MKQIILVAAVDSKGGIGIDNTMAWKLPKEIAFFKDFTTRTTGGINVVIMGKNTWNSIPDKFRPLPNRFNIVLTKKGCETGVSGTLFCPSLESALEKAQTMDSVESVFIIGGASLYKKVLEEKLCDYLVVSRIFHDFHCNVFIHGIDPNVYKTVDDGVSHVINDVDKKTGTKVKFETRVYKK